MLKVGLCGQGDHDNFGDSLIFACYMKIVESYQCEPVLFHVSDIFKKRLTDLGFKFKDFGVDKIDDFVNYVDVSIFVPGGYFGCPDITNPIWQKFWCKENFFSLLAKKMNLAQKKYIVHGTEVGPLLYPFAMGPIGSILDNASRVYVRNDQSQKYISRNYPGVKSTVLPDFILGLNDFFPFFCGNKQYDIGFHITGKITANNWFSKNFLDKVVLESIKTNKFGKIVLFSDQPMTASVLSKVEEIKNRIISCCDRVDIVIYSYSDVYELLEVISQCKVILTTKLHVGVCGLVYGSKVVSISSHPKLARFYNDNGLGEYSLGFFSSTSKEKIELINRVVKVSSVDYFSPQFIRNRDYAEVCYRDIFRSFISE